MPKPAPRHEIPRATKKQIQYMEILFNDCGFDTRIKRLDYLIIRNIDVRFLDQMTVRQALVVIEDLLERRGEKRREPWDDRNGPDDEELERRMKLEH